MEEQEVVKEWRQMEEQDEVTKWRQMEEQNEVKEVAADGGTE